MSTKSISFSSAGAVCTSYTGFVVLFVVLFVVVDAAGTRLHSDDDEKKGVHNDACVEMLGNLFNEKQI